MFGKKKKYERQWLLDVRSRSKPMKAVRLRMAASALAISAGIVIALFVCWKGSEYLIDQFVYTNPRLAIEQIDVSTDGIIPVEQIRRWANVKDGQNLLELDLSRIKRDLELIPLIAGASVERVLPRRLIIRVREREPVARVVVFGPGGPGGLLEASSLYLDEQGMVIPLMLRALNQQAFDAATVYLPTITGVGGVAFRPGYLVESPQLLAALKWIAMFRASEMAGHVDVRSVDIVSGTSLVVSTEQGNEVSFAYRDFEVQFARWRKIHDFAHRNSRAIGLLDLAVTNYIPAVWLDLTTGAQAVRPQQTSPYRKKHV